MKQLKNHISYEMPPIPKTTDGETFLFREIEIRDRIIEALDNEITKLKEANN